MKIEEIVVGQLFRFRLLPVPCPSCQGGMTWDHLQDFAYRKELRDGKTKGEPVT